jgi:hypothetical protein
VEAVSICNLRTCHAMVTRDLLNMDVQNLSSFHLLSKNIKIVIYKAIILPAVLYGCET